MDKGKSSNAAQSHAPTVANTPKEKPITKLEAIKKLAYCRVLDLTLAKKDADELAGVGNQLVYSDHEGLAMFSKVLYAVEFLIDVETEYGNQDLSGPIAHGLSEIIHDCAGNLHDIVSRAAEEETQS